MRTNFRMQDKNVTMVKGDTVSFGLEVMQTDSEGNLVPFEEDLDTAYFTCKQNYTDLTSAFQKSLGDGITKIGTGKYAVRIAPADTAKLEAGKYFYDLQIGVNGDIFTILKGILDIEQDVTVGESTGSMQSKEVTPTESVQVVVPDADYIGLSQVTVEAIPSDYVKPTGTKYITHNGTYNVKEYESANVSVSGGITPTGTKSISANGTYDVTNYASADVSVPNTYGAGDEGKVVSNGALVAQSSDTVTTNDTYDTTLINSLTVNVSGGGSSPVQLLDTITVSEQSRAVNIDLTPYSSYNLIYILIDATLTSSDWIYYNVNGSSPSGGSYQNSMVHHQGICFIMVHPPAGNDASKVMAGTPSTNQFALNSVTVTNLYAYTYNASHYFDVGSVFEIYGGNYADM